METRVSAEKTPSCGCETPRLRTFGPGQLTCQTCDARWSLEDGSWVLQTNGKGKAVEEVEEKPEKAEEKAEAVEHVCLLPGCDGRPVPFSPFPGKYAMRCPSCGLSGPLMDTEEEAVAKYASMYAEPEEPEEEPEEKEEDAAPGMEHTDFELKLYAKRREMEERWGPLHSPEEGQSYLWMRMKDFGEYLRTPREERDPHAGWDALVNLAATAQRIAEDTKLTGHPEHHNPVEAEEGNPDECDGTEEV